MTTEETTTISTRKLLWASNLATALVCMTLSFFGLKLAAPYIPALGKVYTTVEQSMCGSAVQQMILEKNKLEHGLQSEIAVLRAEVTGMKVEICHLQRKAGLGDADCSAGQFLPGYER